MEITGAFEGNSLQARVREMIQEAAQEAEREGAEDKLSFMVDYLALAAVICCRALERGED